MVEIDPALRQHPPDDLGNPEPLGYPLSQSAITVAQTPAAPANRPFDPQYHPGIGVGAPRAVHFRASPRRPSLVRQVGFVQGESSTYPISGRKARSSACV